MYGLKKNNKNTELFEFELEKDLQDNNKNQELIQKVDKRINEIKTKLRQGSNSEEFDDLGLLLHGYSSLHKVLTRASKK
jgi:predicted  nucleic acid-binding Zn-ribbon protein